MTHENKVLLFVMDSLEEYHLTAQGKRDLAELVAAGFRPTDAEIKAATAYLRGEKPGEVR